MTFKKGQSGNPGGRGSDKQFRQALMISLKETAGNFKKIRKVTDALVTKAIEGNVQAIALIADRIDGKVEQRESVQEEREAIFSRASDAVDRLYERFMTNCNAGTGDPKQKEDPQPE